jgi:CBS domain-containing protein
MTVLVRHAMTAAPQTISPHLNASDAAGLMKTEDVGALPVVEEGRLLGLVTDRDLVLRVLAERRDPLQVEVGEIMTRSPVTVTPDMRLSQARDLMEQHEVRRLPVTKADELVGIVSLGDLAWADASPREMGETLRAVSESASTTTLNEDVPRGTPERVRESRKERGSA